MVQVRIVVADDHEIVRRGLKSLLEAQEGWEVVAEASSGREACERVRELQPNVAVLDVGMPEMNGLEATRSIARTSPQTQVLILTMHESEQMVRDVLDAGARGYVLKSDAGRDLVSAVEALLQHRTFFSPKISDMLLSAYLQGGERPMASATQRSRLTAREREIVQLLAEGKSNKEVAGALGISVHTAETHRSNIMRKLDLRSMSELVRYAIREHIIQA